MSGRLGKLIDRMAEVAGEAAGRHLAQRATGRLDHTWTARNSTNTPAYEAAAKNRSNADWRAGLTTATMAIVEGLDTMLARSRWMIRNDGYAASAQGGFRRKVVGGGITARAAARDPDTNEMLTGYNTSHDLLWNSWALDPRLCDVEQTKSLYEKQAVWMDELFAAGGVLLIAVYTPNKDGIGLAIQEIEYEQLDRTLTNFGGRAVYNGIETNQFGAPVAYHVFAAAHPLEETPSVSTRIEADRVWHVFRKTRVRQRLGAPMMAAVMPALRNLSMYELYTISKARTEAAYHGFITDTSANATKTPDQLRNLVSAAPPTGASDNPNELQVRVENGLFPVLRNQKVEFAPSTTPNTVYPPFVLENLKKIAAGTGLDVPTITRWYAEGNFNTQRKAQLEMEAETDALRDLQFINGALRGIREQWTDIAVDEKKLKATGYRESARWRTAYLTTNWQGPPKQSVDEIKDQAAWDMKLRGMRASLQDYFNERGLDPRDVLAEIAEFKELAEDLGLGAILDEFYGTTTVNAPTTGKQPRGSGDDADPADAAPGGRGGTPDLSRRFADQYVLKSVLDEPGGNGRH